MRLNAQEVNTIKKLAIKFFGKDTKVYIFGSRADNKRRGGDIDIYVEVFADDEEKLFDAKTFFIVQLRAVLGEQKIDVVLNLPPLKREDSLFIQGTSTCPGLGSGAA